MTLPPQSSQTSNSVVLLFILLNSNNSIGTMATLCHFFVVNNCISLPFNVTEGFLLAKLKMFYIVTSTDLCFLCLYPFKPKY